MAALVALALLCSALAYIMYFELLARAGASNTLLVTMLVPFSATLLGTFLLGERLSPADLAGMLLILPGLMATDGRVFRALRQRPG